MTGASIRMNKALILVFALIFTVSLCWPMLVSGQLLAFYDTRSYLRGGEKIWDILFDLLSRFSAEDAASAPSAAAGGEAPASLTVNEEGKNVTGRSFPYSAFAYAAYGIAGPIGVALAQAAVSTVMIAYLVNREARQSPTILILGAILVATLTALPWYSTFLMPDIFGAFVVLFGVILVRDIDDLGFWATTLLVGLGAFAATAHYGNMPLMLGIVVSALGIRLLRRRLTWKATIAGIVALSFAPVVNLGASAVVLDEASVAPKRLPILLARSLNDGPALWYLEDVCPEADLGLCEAYGDEFSSDTTWFLWSDVGVLSLSPELLDRIRDEEFKVVFAALRAYPVEQLQSFFGHAMLQLVRVGISEIVVAEGISEGYDPLLVDSGPAQDLIAVFDRIIPVVVVISGVAFLGLFLFNPTARWFDMAAVYVLGYGGNALIYGGLSAPIDRYQGRTAWLIPVFAIVLLAEIVSKRRRSRNTSYAVS